MTGVQTCALPISTISGKFSEIPVTALPKAEAPAPAAETPAPKPFEIRPPKFLIAVTENKQNFDLTKDEQEHRQLLEVDQQEHEQEMDKLKLEHEAKAHRYCQHEWGDSDHDGHLECQKCGLLKDQFDDSH